MQSIDGENYQTYCNGGSSLCGPSNVFDGGNSTVERIPLLSEDCFRTSGDFTTSETTASPLLSGVSAGVLSETTKNNRRVLMEEKLNENHLIFDASSSSDSLIYRFFYGGDESRPRTMALPKFSSRH